MAHLQKAEDHLVAEAAAALGGAVDAHCHIVGSPASIPAIADTRIVPVSSLFAMSSSQAEWPAVNAAALAFPSRIIPAFGIHPWFSSRSVPKYDQWINHTSQDAASCDTSGGADANSGGAHPHNETPWLANLRSCLLQNPHAIVGEIGLDGVALDRPTRELYPMDQQTRVFDAQMLLASELARPVSVHAVHVHGRILDYFRALDRKCARAKAEWKRQQARLDCHEDDSSSQEHEEDAHSKPLHLQLPCPSSIMLHSFTGSAEIARTLVRLPHIGSRFFFSFSDKVNGPTNKFADRVCAIPEDRILIESDVHDALLVADSLARICARIASARQWSISRTIQLTTRNAQSFLSAFRKI